MTNVGRRSSIWVAPLVCLMVLVGGGAAHRWLGGALAAAPSFVLDPPLSALPFEVGAWRGTDIPLDDRVIAVAGSDDQIYRRYIDQGTGEAVELYVAYASRPAKMLGHRPEICYPAQGWVRTTEVDDHIATAGAGGLDCRVQSFSRSRTTPEAVTVLNYYILRGESTADWRDFWGPRWRLPNLSRDPDFYVVSVIVASVGVAPSRMEMGEQSVKRFAGEVAPLVDGLLAAHGAGAGLNSHGG